MDYLRARSIRENFENFDNSVRKLLVFSFWNNVVNQQEFFSELDMDYLEIGFQTQPLAYFTWFVRRGYDINGYGMRPNTNQTKELVKKKLVEKLKEIDLL